EFVGVGRRRPEDLEVEVDLVERKGDVLVGLGFDRELEVLLFLPGRHDDLLGDHHGGGQGKGNVPVAGGEPLPGALQPVADLVQIYNVAVGDDVLGQGFDDVPFEPVDALAHVRELDQLDRGRADVDADQRRRLHGENIEGRAEFFSDHGVSA